MSSFSAIANRSAEFDVNAVLGAVDTVLLSATRPVALHEPRLGARERELVVDCIDTNWVSSAGKYVTQFEEMVAAATGARHAVAIVNGTAALHAALLLEGVEANDEVIMPAITFVATANAVSHAGAMPHFVDSTWNTLGLDPVALEAHLEQISARSGPAGVCAPSSPCTSSGIPSIWRRCWRLPRNTTLSLLKTQRNRLALHGMGRRVALLVIRRSSVSMATRSSPPVAAA
jgi:DegT/DnrJ/EryC1/StrS aminotransferase family